MNHEGSEPDLERWRLSGGAPSRRPEPRSGSPLGTVRRLPHTGTTLGGHRRAPTTRVLFVPLLRACPAQTLRGSITFVGVPGRYLGAATRLRAAGRRPFGWWLSTLQHSANV